MGNEDSKPNSKGSVPIYNKNINKDKLDMVVKKVYFSAQLNKDRRKGQMNQREKELLKMVTDIASKRNKDNEFQKASAIVNDLKWIKAHECIMRYADVIKDNEMVIQMSKGDPRKINDLLPYVESILWGGQKVNLECTKEFSDFVIENFGADVYSQLAKSTQVTDDLKSCFDSILPSDGEVKDYLIDFCKRNSIELSNMNAAGHKLCEEEVVVTKKIDIITINPNPQIVNPNPYPIQYQPTYPQPYGQFPGPGGYPNQYPNPYPYGGGYQIPNQGPYQPPYQPVNNYPYGVPQQDFQKQISVKPEDCHECNPYAPQEKKLPPTIPTTNEVKPTPQPFNNSPYPDFQKFTIDVPTNGKPNDPLNDLDIRLKNIKDGL